MPVASRKTLRDVILEYALAVLNAHDGNRTRAAEELDISARTMTNYVNEMFARGWDVPRPPNEIAREQFIQRIKREREARQ
jgi:hypothetical protein